MATRSAAMAMASSRTNLVVPASVIRVRWPCGDSSCDVTSASWCGLLHRTGPAPAWPWPGQGREGYTEVCSVQLGVRCTEHSSCQHDVRGIGVGVTYGSP